MQLGPQIHARMVEVIGIGNVAVIDGPLGAARVVEARPLLEDPRVAWALGRYGRHALDIDPMRSIAIVYVAPDRQVHFLVEPAIADALATAGPPVPKLPLLQPHHVLHRHQRIGMFSIRDFPTSRRTLTLVMPGSDHVGARFQNKSYQYTFDGVGYARQGQYLRVDGSRTPTSEYDEQRAEAMQVERDEPVVVRYAPADGVTLTGNTKLYKDRIARISELAWVRVDGRHTEVRAHFRWSANQRFWYVPGSRDAVWSKTAVDKLAEALRVAGVPNVEVAYTPASHEPEDRPVLRTPHGWPPIDDNPDAIPRYPATNYRWHTVLIERNGGSLRGYATNIEGHTIVAEPPSGLGVFWVLVVDGERWGRAQDNFHALAHQFHTDLIPTLEPVPEPEPVPESRVVPPTAVPAPVARLANAWAEHVAAHPKSERPWTNVTNTSCFVRNEHGVDVTLCPTPQKRAVENCPPLVPSPDDKTRRVMLCGGDEGVFHFGSVTDARVEGDNMAIRKRLRQGARESTEGWPAADDFPAQERFVDELVPARLVFDRVKPFTLLPVELAPPGVETPSLALPIGEWGGRELPTDASFEPRVLVGTQAMSLRKFVDALGERLFVYRGSAAQATIDALLERLSRAQRVALERKKTANDIGHGVFDGRSLYWLGDGEAEFVGPVFANGRVASGRAKEAVLERFSKPLALPDSLPRDWTLDDTVVLAGLVGGEPMWSAWNTTSSTYANKRESADAWQSRKALEHSVEAETGEPAYVMAAFASLDHLLDQAPATVRLRVAGPWLGLVYPSDYGSRVVFDPPTGGELDLASLERIRDRHQQRRLESPAAPSHEENFKRAKRRVEWARTWLQGTAATSAAPLAVRRPPRSKPKLEPTPTPKPAPAKPVSPERVTETTVAQLAKQFGIEPGQTRTSANRSEAIYEAEKRGFGPKLRSWLVKHRLIESATATEFGARARGRLAFERKEAWPPPPSRGASYSAPEFTGILDSLRHSPEAQAATELGQHWAKAIAQIPGAAHFYRSHDFDQQVRHHVLNRTPNVSITERTPQAARARYERMQAVLAALSAAMRSSLDPTLYDKSRQADEVYKTLCEISNDIAKEILEELYGVAFVERRDHYKLCDGDETLDGLGRKAQARATADAAQQTETNLQRLADAKALLAIAQSARTRGELTEKRFNHAYWRLHPEMPAHQRDDHRLQLTWFPSFRQRRGVAPEGSDKPTEARVRGPGGHGFSVRVPRAANEVVVIEALLDSLRQHVAELEPQAMPTESTKPKRRGRSTPPHTPPATSPRTQPPVDRAKLRSIADSMAAKANAELGVDRQENTQRRASMAAGIRDRARRHLVLAQTMRRIADAADAGGYPHIAKVASRADLEALEAELERAGATRRQAEHVFEYWRRTEPEPVDIDHAEFRGLRTDAYALLALIEHTKAAAGLDAARRLLQTAAKRLEHFGPLQPREVEAVRSLLDVVRRAKANANPRGVENLDEGVRDLDRLARLGIVDTPTLRAALREYLSCCRSHERKAKDDPIAVKKRELAFANIPGFFPTPRPLVERMLDEAELAPGMRVLEPSAGDGAIALVLRERHPDIELDVVERQHSLRSLLEAQGLIPVADDFRTYAPAALYDRIVMNPPFEAKQDVEHITHALDLLAPGGRLVAIASSGLSFRDDAKTLALRAQIEALGGRIEPLPAGSFEPSGTSVNTVIVIVDAPTVRPQPRKEAMTDCSAEPNAACPAKPKKPKSTKKPTGDTKQKLAAEVAKRELATPPPKQTKQAPKKAASKPTAAAKPTTAKEPAVAKPKPKSATKKPSGKNPSAAKKKSTKKPAAAKLPSWHYTSFRDDRYRYREVAGMFIVERHKDNVWVSAPVTAARAIHEKSESICSLAAKILADVWWARQSPNQGQAPQTESRREAGDASVSRPLKEPSMKITIQLDHSFDAITLPPPNAQLNLIAPDTFALLGPDNMPLSSLGRLPMSLLTRQLGARAERLAYARHDGSAGVTSFFVAVGTQTDGMFEVVSPRRLQNLVNVDSHVTDLVLLGVEYELVLRSDGIGPQRITLELVPGAPHELLGHPHSRNPFGPSDSNDRPLV